MDHTAEIVKSICPTWETRNSRNEWFISDQVDIEVMEIETQFVGWKMALNVTEFLLPPNGNLRSYVDKLQNCVRTKGVILVDNNKVNNKPLVEQCVFGYMEEEPKERSRLLHCNKHGNYVVGRHQTILKCEEDKSLFLAYAGWVSFDEIQKKRRLQVASRVPYSEFQEGKALVHYLPNGIIDLEEKFNKHLFKAYNLFNHAAYKKNVEDFLKNYLPIIPFSFS